MTKALDMSLFPLLATRENIPKGLLHYQLPVPCLLRGWQRCLSFSYILSARLQGRFAEPWLE